MVFHPGKLSVHYRKQVPNFPLHNWFWRTHVQVWVCAYVHPGFVWRKKCMQFLWFCIFFTLYPETFCLSSDFTLRPPCAWKVHHKVIDLLIMMWSSNWCLILPGHGYAQVSQCSGEAAGDSGDSLAQSACWEQPSPELAAYNCFVWEQSHYSPYAGCLLPEGWFCTLAHQVVRVEQHFEDDILM